MTRDAYLLHLDRAPYGPTEALQERLVAARQAEAIPDGVLLVEHTPVITLGRRGDRGHILAPPETLAQEGIAVCRTERGGDVTYHGPGQLVGYPIVDIRALGLGASDYMHALEAALMAALAEYGLGTRRREGIIGVWVGENKVAALGVRIKRGVAYHGFALNVAANMRHWATILACGITDGGVTSMHLELPAAPALDEVRERVTHHLGRLLGLRFAPTSLADLEARLAEGEEETTERLPSVDIIH